MISIKKLFKSFGGKRVIDGIDLDIPEGKTTAIIGPSGCGKSTLLRLILALDRPDAGSILVDGKDVTKLSEDQMVSVRRQMGMVFQNSALFDSMTVGENVSFGLVEHAHLTSIETNRIVQEKLALVGLQGTEKLMPAELSGGMQKRVSLARALALNPKILLYDEPTTGLDPVTSLSIEELINKLSKELKVTSVLVTHQLSTIFRTASWVVMLNGGKLIDGGTVEQSRKSNNGVLRDFIQAGIV